METNKLISRLYQTYEDYTRDNLLKVKLQLPDICCDCLEAANKLASLQRLVDDMLGDHYVDYLEFYTNRCRELEEKIDNIKNILEE